MRFPALPLLLLALTPDGLFAQAAFKQTEAPQPVRRITPVYPYELLIQGREGTAEVQFTADESGRAILTSIISASDPAFAEALRAEIESNEFMPIRVNGRAKFSPAQLVFKFAIKPEPIVAEILAELRKPEPALPRSTELDAPVAAVRQEQFNYPYTLETEMVDGAAEIEIVIDREGRVRCPRIVSATKPELGYAACALVSRWRYQPPMKDGKATHARHVVKVSYDTAKMAASW